MRNRSEKASRRHRDKSTTGSRKKKGAPLKDSSPKEKRRGRGHLATFQGRVQKNRRGFGFVIPQDTSQKDAFIPPSEARYLMNNDVIEYSVERDGRRMSATIHKIIKRAHTELVGQVAQGPGKGFVLQTEDGEAYPVTAPQGERLIAGEFVITEVEQYPTPETSARVRVVERLGGKLVPRFDIKIAAAKFGLRTEFPGEAIDEAEQAENWAREEMDDPQEREDLRKLPFVTIDGEDAKDFDDAILVERHTGQKAFTLYVAIADVSYFVTPGSALDKEARRRSTSVYFPGTCIPMLPEEISNELCSLKPRQERLALTAEIHLNYEGHIIESFFYKSIIQTARRLTYNQVHEYFQGGQKELADLDEPLKAAYALFKQLLKSRKERGVLDFDLPESKIEVDEVGRPTVLGRTERLESHKLIEEFMILANGEVARALRKGNALALYRVHEEPDPSTIDDINGLMRNLGISKSIKDLKPRTLSALLASTLEMKSAKTLHQAILRLQKQARYEPEPKGHFGLALRDYTHFTSPIRRYPDLLVHRALKKLIARKKNTDKKSEGLDYFTQAGIETSELERRAMEAERFVRRRKQCWYMQGKLGETLKGVICGVIATGVFLEIPELGVEGFLPIDSLPGRYVFEENRMCLRLQPGHTILSLGDELTVVVANVDVEQGQITFSTNAKE